MRYLFMATGNRVREKKNAYCGWEFVGAEEGDQHETTEMFVHEEYHQQNGEN